MLELVGWNIQSTVFGSTLEQYFYFFSTLLGFIILGKVIQHILDRYARKLVQRTANDWDDLLLDTIFIPTQFLFLILGLGIGATLFLTFSDPGIEEFYYKVLGLITLGGILYTLVRLIDLFAERVLLRITSRTKSNLDDQLVPLVKRILKYAVVSMGVLVALDNFGYDITALLAGLGIGGLAIAFAAQETVKDVFGGLTIFANKSFFIGDKVTINGVTGDVETINLRSTRIRNLDGRIVTMPNSRVAGENIENWSTAPGRKTFIALSIVYDTTSAKLEEAKAIIRKVLEETNGIKKDTSKQKNILIWFSEFAASSLNINVIYWVEDQQNLLSIWDHVNTTIKREFEKAHIEFAFPTQTVYYQGHSSPSTGEKKLRKE